MVNNKFEKYIIVCDESVRKGNNYSFFYGGCIVKEKDYENISKELDVYKEFLGLHEIKREKITPKNLASYKKMMDLFFRYVKAGDVRVRIMYSPNKELSTDRGGKEELYPKLYYTFLKRAFSLFNSRQNIYLRIFMDELPESIKINKKFKRLLISGFIKESKRNDISIKILKKDIVEVDSKKHVLLQCIDVITGIIEYYLNANNENRNSTRGKAKLELWNYIFENYILALCENLDFNMSTGYFSSFKAWMSKYKHLVFKRKKSPN